MDVAFVLTKPSKNILAMTCSGIAGLKIAVVTSIRPTWVCFLSSDLLMDAYYLSVEWVSIESILWPCIRLREIDGSTSLSDY